MKKPDKIVLIRRELKALIVAKQQLCTTEKQKNNAVNEARMEINKKYGKDWRGNTQNLSTDSPSIYDGHINGEHWMD
jgi:hypothetical protein